MKQLVGRSSDVIRLPSGRNVHTMVFSRNLKMLPHGLVQWQAVRKGPQEFELEYIASRPMQEELDALAGKLSQLLDDAELCFRRVENIPKLPSGKFSYFREDWQDPASTL